MSPPRPPELAQVLDTADRHAISASMEAEPVGSWHCHCCGMNAFPGCWHGCGHNPGQEGSPWSLWGLRSCQSGCSSGAAVKVLCCSQALLWDGPRPRQAGSHRPASLPTGPDAAGTGGSHSPTDRVSQSDYKGENILDNAGSRLHRKKAKAVANVTLSPASPSERRQRGEWGARVRGPSRPGMAALSMKGFPRGSGGASPAPTFPP